MLGILIFSGIALIVLGLLGLSASVEVRRGPVQASALLGEVVAALKADQVATIKKINLKQEGLFRKGDMYPFCFNLDDDSKEGKGVVIAGQTIGGDIRTLKDPDGDSYGQRDFDAAQKPEGVITQVEYRAPKPGPDRTPVPKVSKVTRVGKLGCGVGYYPKVPWLNWLARWF